MERTTKLRITTIRKRTINLSISGHRAFCRQCSREVQMLVSSQAAELLGTSQPQLEELIISGQVHAVTNPSGGLWICKDSLVPE